MQMQCSLCTDIPVFSPFGHAGTLAPSLIFIIVLFCFTVFFFPLLESKAVLWRVQFHLLSFVQCLPFLFMSIPFVAYNGASAVVSPS
jgi:hypothetical protein